MSWIRNGVGSKSAEDIGTSLLPRRTYGQGRRRDIRGEGSTKSKVLLPIPMKCNEPILPKNASPLCSDNDKENVLWEDVGECSVDKTASEDDLSLHSEGSLLGAVRIKKQLNAKEFSLSYSSSTNTSRERQEEGGGGGICKEENSLLTCNNSISHEDSSRKNHHLIPALLATPHHTSKTLPDAHEMVESASFNDTNSGAVINGYGETRSNSPSTHKETTTYLGNHDPNSRNGNGGGLSPLALGICNLSPILARAGFELEDDGIMFMPASEPNPPPVVARSGECSIKVTDDDKNHQSTISPGHHDNASHNSENDDEMFGTSDTVSGECKEDTFPNCTERKLSVIGIHKTGVGRRMTAMSGLKFPYNKSLESKQRNVSMAKLRRVSMGMRMHESIGMHARERHVVNGNLVKKVEALKLDSKSSEVASNTVLGSLPTHYNVDTTTEYNKNITDMDTKLLATTFEYLSINQIKSTIYTCRKWAKAGTYALASKSCHPQVLTANVLRKTFTCASFLSDGAYKCVYRVWNSTRQAEEAISVMDTQTINQMGHEAVIAQELHFSVLSSALVRRGICPNFIETYGTCNSAMDPHSAWDMIDQQQSSKNNIEADSHLEGTETKAAEVPRYCFIGMELCGEGDAEGLLRRNGVISVENTMCVLFQALFSLYSGRSEYRLRHGDIKLLNFLVRPWNDVIRREGEEGNNIIIHYGLGKKMYCLRMPQLSAYCIKLGDFGTSELLRDGDSPAVRVHHFSTLENTPPELLVLGTHADVSFAMDTFQMALSMLHLFTGDAPYELMVNVRCPLDLRNALAKVYSENDEFGVIVDVILSQNEPEPHEAAEDSEEDDTLFDTFYRILVLFGMPSKEEYRNAYGEENLVWKAVTSILLPERRSRKQRKNASVKQFSLHRKQWSLTAGYEAPIARARERLETAPGAMDLLLSMASWDPSVRPTMFEALQSPAFQNLAIKNSDEDAFPPHKRYVAYGGSRQLSNV